MSYLSVHGGTWNFVLLIQRNISSKKVFSFLLKSSENTPATNDYFHNELIQLLFSSLTYKIHQKPVV